MINRILYWFITLPLLGKAGCLTTVIIVSACTLTSIASIPASQARRAAQATQVAINNTATGVANATATTVAEQQANATNVALAARATQTSVAQIALATETAVVASTATAKSIADATSSAVALAATNQANVNARATALAAATPIPVAAAQISYKELGRYNDAGRTWVNILIPPAMDRETLVQLAQQLREQDVSSSFNIFDDASQLDQFVNSSINYGKVRDKDGVIKDITQCADIQYCSDLVKQGKDAYPYPEEWANQHYIAMINEMAIARGRLQWQLMIQKDGTTVDIDVEKTAWDGRRKDGDVTEQEVDGWTQEYMSIAKTYACCVKSVDIVDRQKMEVVVTLDGELALRPDQARQSVATAVFINFDSRLGECLRTVRFIDAKGNPFPDAYTNGRCD